MDLNRRQWLDMRCALIQWTHVEYPKVAEEERTLKPVDHLPPGFDAFVIMWFDRPEETLSTHYLDDIAVNILHYVDTFSSEDHSWVHTCNEFTVIFYLDNKRIARVDLQRHSSFEVIETSPEEMFW